MLLLLQVNELMQVEGETLMSFMLQFKKVWDYYESAVARVVALKVGMLMRTPTREHLNN